MPQSGGKLAGAGTVSVGTVAVSITGGTATPCSGVWVQVDPVSGGPVYIGGSDAQTLLFDKTDMPLFDTSDAANIYAKAVSGTVQLNYQPKGN